MKKFRRVSPLQLAIQTFVKLNAPFKPKSVESNCPMFNGSGTKDVTITYQDNGTITAECEGFTDAVVCQGCEMFKGRERA